MNEVIEIHPYDFAELLASTPISLEDVLRYEEYPSKENVIVLGGKTYHQSVNAPRTAGPHTIY